VLGRSILGCPGRLKSSSLSEIERVPRTALWSLACGSKLRWYTLVTAVPRSDVPRLYPSK
jgi:hypothetical protein